MPTYKAKQQAIYWNEFDGHDLAGKKGTLAAGSLIIASIAGVDRLGYTILKFGTDYTKLWWWALVEDAPTEPDPDPAPPPPPIPTDTPLFRFKPHSNPRITAMQRSIATGTTVGLPDILQLGIGDGPRTVLTKAWQLYIADLNPNLPRNRVAGMLGDRVAFSNGTGFGETPRQNWLTGEDLNVTALPLFDKVRTCAYACHSGRVEGSELVLTILDGNNPPPKIADVNPISHPHLFFYATIVWVNSNGLEVRRSAFGNKSAPAWGIPYNVTVMPLVSKYQIRVQLTMVEYTEAYTLPFLNYP